MSNCTHEFYEAVEVRNHLTGEAEIVSHICRDCMEELPAWWGCADCETAEGNRKVSESVPKLYLTRPCRRHQEAL